MRPVRLVVWDKQIGMAKTWAYPDGIHLGQFLIPMYELTVSGTNANGSTVERTFKVLRFGLQFKSGFAEPKVVGLADQQTHTIQGLDTELFSPLGTVHGDGGLASLRQFLDS